MGRLEAAWDEEGFGEVWADTFKVRFSRCGGPGLLRAFPTWRKAVRLQHGRVLDAGFQGTQTVHERPSGVVAKAPLWLKDPQGHSRTVNPTEQSFRTRDNTVEGGIDGRPDPHVADLMGLPSRKPSKGNLPWCRTQIDHSGFV